MKTSRRNFLAGSFSGVAVMSTTAIIVDDMAKFLAEQTENIRKNAPPVAKIYCPPQFGFKSGDLIEMSWGGGSCQYVVTHVEPEATMSIT